MEPILSSGEPPRIWQSPPEIPPGCSISEADVEYLRVRGVSAKTARAAGWYTALKPSQVPDVFSRRQRGRVPALIAPHLSPDGETVGYQKRDHHPGRDKKGELLKWVSPPKERARPVIAVHPWTADEATGGTGELWAVEGITRLLALAERGIPAVSYAGCYTWQKGGEPLEDWRAVNLGRLVNDVPDADARINEQVQDMQATRVPFFESRGASVLAVEVTTVNGDEHAGLDDYLGAGLDLDALERGPFKRVDVARVRLTRDERLRRFVAAKLREVEDLSARKDSECNARRLARWVVGNQAPAHGKRRARGMEVHPSLMQMAEGIRVGSLQTAAKARDLLIAAGFMERVPGRRGEGRADSYLLLYPWGEMDAQSVNKEGYGVGGEEGQEHHAARGETETPLSQRESHACLHSAHIEGSPDEKVPALRASKLVHTYAMREGRRVVVHSDYFKRYGAKGEETIRHVHAAGCVRTSELLEAYGGKTSTLRRYFETHIAPKIKDGVLRGDLETVEMAPGWREALERVRAETDEDRDNRLQTAKYQERRRAYRTRDRRPADLEPALMGKEKVREVVSEMREREVQPALAFVRNTLDRNGGVLRLELLSDLWTEHTGRDEGFYLRLALRRLGCRQRVHRDFPDRIFVRAPEAWPDLGATEPEGAAGEVVPMSKRVKDSARDDPPENLTKPDTATPGNSAPDAGSGLVGADSSRRPDRLQRRAPINAPGNLIEPDTGDPLDVFRNNPMQGRRMMRNDESADAPRKMPPKVGGRFKHGPECGCWLCEDEPAESAPAGIGASA